MKLHAHDEICEHLKKSGLHKNIRKGKVHVSDAAHAEFKEIVERDYAHLSPEQREAVLVAACLTHPNHCHKKSSKVLIRRIAWAIAVLVVLLICLGKARGQSQIEVIGIQNNGTTVATYASPFKINFTGAGITCTKSGSTVTCAVSAGGGSFSAGGDLGGNSSSQTVTGLRGSALPALAAGYLNYSGSAWNLATLSAVAVSGSYTDLSNKPTIPAAQVNSDWNAGSGLAQILNKPTLAAVATSGSYTDLLSKPTIPAAQVQTDWTAVAGMGVLLNKPTIPTQFVAGGDLSGSVSSQTVAGLKGVVLPTLATGYLNYSGSAWQFSTLGTTPVNTTATANNFLTAYNSSTGAFTKARPTWADVDKTTSSVADLATRTCSTLSDAGTGCSANISLYAPLSGPTFTGTVSGISATMVGLGSVTNDAQTKAAVVPNTLTAHALYAGNTTSAISAIAVPAADSLLYGTTGVDPSFKALPTTGTNGCSGTGDKLLFNTSTHALTCGVDQTSAGGGVSAFSGDGALLTNSSSTGAVTATVGTAPAHTFWGNNTASAIAGSFDQLACGDLSNAGTGCSTTVGTSATHAQTDFSGVGTPTACTNQVVTGFTLNGNAAPTSTCTTLAAGFMPALTGDATMGAGTTATTVAAIQSASMTVVTALGNSGTISMNFALGHVFTTTPSGAITLTAANCATGRWGTIIVTTSGTTSYTITPSTNFKGTALSTGTTSAKTFGYSFVCNGTTAIQMGAATAAM